MMNLPIAFVQNFSFGEIAIVAFVLVLLFGAKRLPELFGSVGRSINEFKRGMQETAEDVEVDLEHQTERVRSESSKTF